MQARSRAGALLIVLVTAAGGHGGDADPEDALSAARAAAARGDAAAIVEAARARHSALRSFAAEGEAAVQVERVGGPPAAIARFELVVRRPDRYRVVVSAPDGDDAARARLAAWNAGDGAYAYRSVPPAWSRERDQIALGLADSSSGAGATVAALLFGERGALDDLEAPVLRGIERVEGEECWVISASSLRSAEQTLWISTSRLAVLRHQASVSPSPDRIPELIAKMKGDPRGLDEMTQAMGLDPGRRNEVEALMTGLFEAAARNGAFRGSITRTFRNVRLDPPNRRRDFVFEVPEGTPFATSLLAPAPAPEIEAPSVRPAPAGQDAQAILERTMHASGACRRCASPPKCSDG